MRSALKFLLVALAFTAVATGCQLSATGVLIGNKNPASQSQPGGGDAAGPTAASMLDWDGLSTKGNSSWELVPTN